MFTLDLTHPRAGQLLTRAMASTPERLDLAALAVSALEYPSLDVDAVLGELDALGLRVRALTGDSKVPLEQVEALRSVLVDEEGLRGNLERYHEAENSFMHLVLQRKCGIPIALSVVWIEVARRAGIPLVGLGFPGHFLVAMEVPGGKLVVDPFNGGKVLTAADCSALLRRSSPDGNVTAGMLERTPTRAIAWRMLTNLKRLYLGQNDHLRAIRVEDLLLQLAPDHPVELRTRAALLSSMGAFRAALADLERVIGLGPAPDHAAVKMAARALRQRAQFVN